jgi:hypothetical protein
MEATLPMKVWKHRLSRLGACSLSVAAAFVVPSSASADDTWMPLGNGWQRYTNERFGTMAEVPRHLFKLVEPPPANGDGRKFKADDGAELRISGSYGPTVVTDNFEEYKTWLLEHAEMDRLTYRADRKDWLVVSGTRGSNIVYRKVYEGCGAAHEVQIEYPAQVKALFDPVVARISRSLGCTSAQP